jgi:hypothetical protein
MNTPTLGNAVKALRPLFAWALVGYVALYLVFAFLSWLVGSGTFTVRSYNADFVNLYTIVLPLLAVLVATQIEPVLDISKFIAGIALIEYAVALFFGVITFLIGLVHGFDGFDAFRHTVMNLVALGFLALAGYAVARVYLAVGGQLPDVNRLRPQQRPSAQ